MKKQQLKDIKHRLLFKKLETNKIRINLINRVKEKSFLFRLEKSKMYNFYIKIVNRCILSNRKKCIHKKFRISRIMLKSSVYKGLVIGVRKATF